MKKIRTPFAFFYHWHQRIGLVMAIAVIAWGASGLAHPIISRLNPQPLVFAPPQENLRLEGAASVQSLLSAQDIQTIQNLRLFQWQDRAVYRLHSERGIDYFDAVTLQPIADGDARYGEYLARHFLGDQQSTVANITPIYGFDRDYLYVNRYLPVVRVDFQRPDRMRAYIDTEQGRLATLVDRRKAITSRVFRGFHSWTWIDNLPLRRFLMSGFLLLGFTTALFGLVVYLKGRQLGISNKNPARQHHPASRRVHRTVGALVAVPVMAFSLSGMLHLWLTEKDDAPQPRLVFHSAPTQLLLNPSEFGAQWAAITSVELAHIAGTAYWRIVPAKGATGGHEHHRSTTTVSVPEVVYLDTTTGHQLEDGWQEHAQRAAVSLTGFPASALGATELVTSFIQGEYGFINKRLPVHAVHFDLPGAPTVYVETATNTLASLTTTSRRVEGYSFAWLHKWRFADSLGKDLRDGLQALVAGLIILILLLGVARFFAARTSSSGTKSQNLP